MPYEISDLPNRSGGDAPGALESAARHLRASPRPAGASPARERSLLSGRQCRDLLAWACENGRLTASSLLDRVEDSGQEHGVWLDTASQRYFKFTHPGRFGFTVIATSGGVPDLTAATPLEYLERLLIQNRVFGDDLRLEGIIEAGGEVSVLTSQPNLTGDPVTPSEITAFMQQLWFQPLTGLSLGHPGALAFYRDLDEVAVFDAHVANFVKETAGTVLPIDLILVGADARLQRALQACST